MLKKHGEIYYVPELEKEIQWTFKINFKKYFWCIYFYKNWQTNSKIHVTVPRK